MRKSVRKSFDCVETMREIRDRTSEEISGMNHAELRRWFRAHRYSDPVLQRLASRGGRDSVSATENNARKG